MKCFPITIYDKNKLINEKNLINLSKEIKYINTTVLRLSNVYGYSLSQSKNSKRGFLNQVIEKALTGKDIYIYGDGKFYRDYIHIDDVLSAFRIVTLQKKCKSKIYNISTGKSYYLIDVIQMIINEAYKLTNLKSKLEFIPIPKNLNDIELRNYTISSNEIKKINWNYKFTIKKGIKKFKKIS